MVEPEPEPEPAVMEASDGSIDLEQLHAELDSKLGLQPAASDLPPPSSPSTRLRAETPWTPRTPRRAPAPLVPPPAVSELHDSMRAHIAWHSAERTAMLQSRLMERLAAEKQFLGRTRAASRASLYGAARRRPASAPGRTPHTPEAELRWQKGVQAKRQADEAKRQQAVAEASVHKDIVVNERELLERLHPAVPAGRKEGPEEEKPWGQHWRDRLAPGDGRVAGKRTLHSRCGSHARGGAITPAEEATPKPVSRGAAVAAAVAAAAAAEPARKAATPVCARRILRKPTPTDRRWHHCGTPTRAYEKMSPKTESQSRGRAATPNKARRVWGGAPKLGQPSGALLRDRPGRYVDIANDTQRAQATKEFILDLAGEEV